MFFERRTHDRASISLPFRLYIADDIYVGKTRNLSIGGVLVRIDSGELSDVNETDIGYCEINDGHKNMGIDCKVLRIAGSDIVLQFINIEFEQDIFIRTLVESHSK